jgi:NADH:ubiquinone oxidoreductase subunit K
VRVLVVSAVTVILLLGAVPLAVPGVPRLHGVPQLVALGVLVLAGAAFVVGLALLALGRSERRRSEAPVEPPRVPVRPGIVVTVR